jgi:hypothetical protein|nr:hypothetical protein [uncultured Prevotella sp.]
MYSVRIQNGTIWNSFFDIGTLASENEYLYIESLYIDLLLDIAREIDVAFFAIEEFENYDSLPLKDGQKISLEKLPFVAKSILRDKCWCKLVNDSMEIHFGYDYIMYVVINKANVNIKPILNEYSGILVIDERISPYLMNS